MTPCVPITQLQQTSTHGYACSPAPLPIPCSVLNGVLQKYFYVKEKAIHFLVITMVNLFWQALGLRRDDTFSVTMLGHCIEMYIGDSEAYIGKIIILLF